MDENNVSTELQNENEEGQGKTYTQAEVDALL